MIQIAAGSETASASRASTGKATYSCRAASGAHRRQQQTRNRTEVRRMRMMETPLEKLINEEKPKKGRHSAARTEREMSTYRQFRPPVRRGAARTDSRKAVRHMHGACQAMPPVGSQRIGWVGEPARPGPSVEAVKDVVDHPLQGPPRVGDGEALQGRARQIPAGRTRFGQRQTRAPPNAGSIQSSSCATPAKQSSNNEGGLARGLARGAHPSSRASLRAASSPPFIAIIESARSRLPGCCRAWEGCGGPSAREQ